MTKQESLYLDEIKEQRDYYKEQYYKLLEENDAERKRITDECLERSKRIIEMLDESTCK